MKAIGGNAIILGLLKKTGYLTSRDAGTLAYVLCG
jgi:hypothetical protein